MLPSTLVTTLALGRPLISVGNLLRMAALLAVAWVTVGFARLSISMLRRRRHLANGVLILGTHPLAARVIEAIESCQLARFRVIGVVDDSPDGTGTLPGMSPFVGRLEQFSQIVAVTRPAHIIIAMADRRGRIPHEPLLASRLRGVIIENASDFVERMTGKLAIESLQPSSLILSKEFRHPDLMASSYWRTFRQVASYACAGAALLVTSPLLVLVALVIKLESRGPVFFIQDRVGLNGKNFGLVKFRTMRNEGAVESQWVSDNAARITSVGQFLRRFRLDEIPQLFNVLRGEMNIVGPRPHPASNQQLFIERIPYYGIRSIVRPGITGWAQVRYGYANSLEEETEKMRYDLYYIKRACLLLDLQIVAKTFARVLFDRGSHRLAIPFSTDARWSDVGLKTSR